MKKLIFTILVVASFIQLQAQKAIKINWDNLKSNDVVFDDPFEKLTEEQLRDLSYVARIRMLTERKPESVGIETLHQVADLEKKLTGEGVDIEGLLAKRYAIAELRKKRSEAVVDSLNGKYITMAGFLLPLDYIGKKGTEFLLVPTVGACIHTPPPPKNQIVYIKFEKGYEYSSQFEPVWIEGELTTKAMTKELFLVDGSSDIDSGYSMSAASIVAYKSQ